MSLLKIIIAPDPRLQVVATPVEKVDDKIRKLMNDMLKTMYAAPGVGLAATQIGVNLRVIVMDIADIRNGEKPNPIKIANPEIIWTSDDIVSYEEGCLSLPGFYEEIFRPAKCKVKGLNENGEEVIYEAEGLLATDFQHEIDHLDGKLFVDHLSRLKRGRILKKLQKQKKHGVFDKATTHPKSTSM